MSVIEFPHRRASIQSETSADGESNRQMTEELKPYFLALEEQLLLLGDQWEEMKRIIHVERGAGRQNITTATL